MADPTYALPPGVLINPFWDMAPDGIALPLWLVVLVILVIALLVPNFWWIYKYLIMRPVAGHGEAARAGNEKTQQCLIFGMNRAFTIQAMEYLEKVVSFKDPTRVARWLQTSPYAVGMLGYKSIMLLSEIFDCPKDPVAEMAILSASKKHNEGIKGDMSGMVIDYNSYRASRKILEHENPLGVDIWVYALYDPGKIYQFTPQNRTAGQFGGTCLKDAGDLNMSQPVKTTWEKAVPIFICLVFGIIAIALTYMFVMNTGNAPAAANASAAVGAPFPV